MKARAAGKHARGDEAVAGADPRPRRLGIIADTHGRLDPSVLAAFAGVVHIIHAGDVGKRGVLRKLESVAPVTAVSGNIDVGKLAKELPAQTEGEAAGIRFLVAHKPKQLRRLLRRGVPEGVRLVVTGHLHEPRVGWEDGVLYLNPGTASSPEEGDPAPTVAVVAAASDLLTVTFVPVGPAAGAAIGAQGRPSATEAAGKVGRVPDPVQTPPDPAAPQPDPVQLPPDPPASPEPQSRETP